MKILLIILLLLGLAALMKDFFVDQLGHIDQTELDAGAGAAPQQSPASDTELQGMPFSLESSLETARQQGADGIKRFLDQYRHAIRDPRLAAIELEYVILVSLRDATEAKRVYKSIQLRTPPSSPLYDRVKSLEKTYQ